MKIILSIILLLQSLYAWERQSDWGIWNSKDDLILKEKTYTLDEALNLFEPRVQMIRLIHDIPENALYSKHTITKYKQHVLTYW